MTTSFFKNDKVEVSFQVEGGKWQNLGNGISWGFTTTNQPKNPYWPTKVIHNGKTTICYFENGSKRVVTCSEEDEFNKEFGFLLALAHEVFGSKDKYRQMYTKKVDKKAYPKLKTKVKKVEVENKNGVSTEEVVEIINRVRNQFDKKES